MSVLHEVDGRTGLDWPGRGEARTFLSSRGGMPSMSRRSRRQWRCDQTDYEHDLKTMRTDWYLLLTDQIRRNMVGLIAVKLELNHITKMNAEANKNGLFKSNFTR